ncbi:DUF4302 domain-containing protein [Marinifilum sp. D737]|uniref:DUF4302 domain-containing protein n=1 Tax=Marinifilum sp. D737 TaxID=2969628 RepID=UPI00227647A6|nr:DUF4302 domain-containing protein [Marinifilum sp. D737]MCY1635992.1 DUF4302 domain-containing protein [Marinifilum sp. D737]
MKKLLYILTGFALLFSSCDNEEDRIFDLDADTRIGEAVNGYQDLLLSAENGWITNYYPNAEILGGFTFLFDFNEDGTVKVAWDINETVETSLYKLSSIERPQLAFDTYSNFSKMTDPEIGEQGVGMGGDYELYFERVSENQDTIYLEGKTNESTMVLVRATQADWTNINKLKDMEAKLIKEEGIHPFYRNLVVEGSDQKFMLSYFEDMRRLNFSFTNDQGKYEVINMGVHFTPVGFDLHEPLVIDGKKVTSFAYDAENKKFLVSNEGIDGEVVFEAEAPCKFKGAAKMYYDMGWDSYEYLSPKLLEKISALNDLGEGEINYFYVSAYYDFWNDVTLYFDDWTSVGFDIAKFEKFDEDQLIMHDGGFDSWDYEEADFMANEGGKALYDILFDANGWTVVPLVVKEYGGTCAIVSNSDPEIFFSMQN